MDCNSKKTHPKFARRYKSGDLGYCLHAEMGVLRFAQPGDNVLVMRWSVKGALTMSKPCSACQRFLSEAGINKVTYTDWEGNFHTFRVRGT